MNNLIEDIIARDIVRLHRINRADILKDMLIILAGSVGSRTSFNKISKVLGVTVDTVKEYMQYLEEAFLIKPLEKWSPSHLDRVYSQKKVYFYDTGIKTVLTGKGDIGAKTENIVFLHLARHKATIGYYAESDRELDFACGNFKSPMAIEVKYDSKFDWQDKRFKGVKLFIKHYSGTKYVNIISKNIEEEIKDSKLKISVIPAWKYLFA